MDIEIRKENLRDEIASLERESSKLQGYEVHKNSIGNYNIGGDVTDKKTTELVRNGTLTQIDNINAKLAQKRAELESLESFDRKPIGDGQNLSDSYTVGVIKTEINKQEEIRKDKLETEQKKKDEDYRKLTFKQVKSMYKKANGRSFERFINFVSGKSPKWRKISQLSQKELDLLIKSYQGETRQLQESASLVRQKKLSFEEERRRIVGNNWQNFTMLLTNQEKLKQELEFEEKKGVHR